MRFFDIKKIINLIAPLVVIAIIGGTVFVAAAPQTVFAAPDTCNKGFLGFPAWYDGLDMNEDCSVKSPSDADGALSKFIWTIGMNVISILMMLGGYISLGFVLYGGFLLMTGRGKSAEIAEAQVTIRNAVIGLAISFGAVGLVKFAAGMISGTTGLFGLPAGDANATLGFVLGMVYMAAGITAVITIIIAGYTYVISGGNPAEVEKSKNTILYAVIGLIVIAGAFTITQFIIGRF
ncbi:MAG: hypothetical protein WA087_03995 [Candidatus Saccharimonadales bacterium]